MDLVRRRSLSGRTVCDGRKKLLGAPPELLECSTMWTERVRHRVAHAF
jgi:hypothetical protein